MANLKLFHVNKIYDGGVHAVKDFCLDIEDKEFVVFVGPSGCGKSTVLRMIAGLEKISSGDLYIGGRYVNALPPKERNISMVFQSYALFPNMSVYDNISYGLRMHGEDKEVIREKVTAAADMLNLTDYLYRKPSQISGGQRQRVALGRAIVRQPDVFLLDEPLSNLDAKLRNKMRNELLALHRNLGATFIYVTHDQVEAMTMGDKIVAMRDGTIMQVGSPITLYNHPDNMFVAGFIGTPQMNFWQGTVSCDGGRITIKTALGDFPLTEELELRFNEDARAEGKRVVIGLRPEDLHVNRNKPTDIEIAADVNVVENFCSYNIFYGEANGEQIVGQDTYAMDLKGKRAGLYVDINRIHLFDAETERSILPIYAQRRTVTARKNGTVLSLLGSEIELPAWQASVLDDGEIRVCIPKDAVTNSGNIPVHCDKVIDTDGGEVSLLSFGSDRLYALGDYSGVSSVGLDLSRIDLIGSRRIDAVPESFSLKFRYEKQIETEENGTVVKHYCTVGNTRMESFLEFNKKMYRLGRGIFRTEYKLYVTPSNLRSAAPDECFPCIEGRVTNVLDYGNKRYSCVSIDGSDVYVGEKLPLGETVTLAVDLDNARVSEANSDTILF